MTLPFAEESRGRAHGADPAISGGDFALSLQLVEGLDHALRTQYEPGAEHARRPPPPPPQPTKKEVGQEAGRPYPTQSLHEMKHVRLMSPVSVAILEHPLELHPPV